MPSLTDSEKVELIRTAFRERQSIRSDRITTTALADALGRDEDERRALAQAFHAVDRDGDVWLQCAEIWLKFHPQERP